MIFPVESCDRPTVKGRTQIAVGPAVVQSPSLIRSRASHRQVMGRAVGEAHTRTMLAQTLVMVRKMADGRTARVAIAKHEMSLIAEFWDTTECL